MEKDKKMTKTIILGILFCLILGGFFLFKNKSYGFERVLTNLNLVPKKETFTELYFEDFDTFPKASVADKSFNFTFTIHNLEGTEMTYPYRVYFLYPNGTEVTIKQDTVRILNNARRSVNVTYTFQSSGLKGKVVVELSNLNQHIDFLLPNDN